MPVFYTLPRHGDNENALLAKIAQSLYNEYGATDSTMEPAPGDNNISLLKKICRILVDSGGPSEFSPNPFDSENDLLTKWANLVVRGF